MQENVNKFETKLKFDVFLKIVNLSNANVDLFCDSTLLTNEEHLKIV
mgnify:CR=1 FL=1